MPTNCDLLLVIPIKTTAPRKKKLKRKYISTTKETNSSGNEPMLASKSGKRVTLASPIYRNNIPVVSV